MGVIPDWLLINVKKLLTTGGSTLMLQMLFNNKCNLTWFQKKIITHNQYNHNINVSVNNASYHCVMKLDMSL